MACSMKNLLLVQGKLVRGEIKSGDDRRFVDDQNGRKSQTRHVRYPKRSHDESVTHL